MNTGCGRDGCYAQYVTADAGYVASVPAAVDPLDAASLACAGVTTYRAVTVSGARTGQLVAASGSMDKDDPSRLGGGGLWWVVVSRLGLSRPLDDWAPGWGRAPRTVGHNAIGGTRRLSVTGPITGPGPL